MKRRKRFQPAYAVVIVAAVVSLFLVMPHSRTELSLPRSGIRSPYHSHADFLVVINGKEMDFSKQEYDVADPFIHLHLRNFAGDRVLHVESREATLGDFFASLGMELSTDCLLTEENEYCTDGANLSFFVNGEKNVKIENYAPKDLDRILVIYGNYTEDETAAWMNKVTDYACIFSLACEPPEEAENRIIYN